MRIISKPFYNDSSSLIQLLEASLTNEVVLYNGAECTIQVEPAYSAQELNDLTMVSPDSWVDTFRSGNQSHQLTTGLFYSRTYKFSFVDESYSMRIFVNNKTVKSIAMSITSTNLQNSKNFSDAEWLEANADSVVRKHNCSIQ